MILQELYKPKFTPKLASTVDSYVLGLADKAKIAADSVAAQQSDNDLYDELTDRLEKMGWEFHDSGYFSSVFINPRKNYILKVNTIPDKGFNYFVNLIKRYPNKHFPIVSNLRVIKTAEHDYYMYYIEKLYPVQYSVENDISTYCLHHLYKMYNHHPNPYSPDSEYVNNNPDFARALDIVLQYHDKFGIDLPGNNIMQRQDGTVVITDPYC